MGFRRRARLLRLCLTGRGHPGVCPVCERRTLFLREGAWLRDTYRCLRCKSLPRHRAFMAVLNTGYPRWRDLRLYESSPGGPASQKLAQDCPQYTSTHYFPDVEPGGLRDGIRCENLERLTFADASFDLVVTQDVFEHVLDPESAFAEIARILSPGGAHVFTMPFYPGRKTVLRAVVASEGIRYLEEPAYHFNPIDAGGALVTRDWGDDLAERIAAHGGLATTIYCLRDPRRGIEGEFLEVFISRKKG